MSNDPRATILREIVDLTTDLIRFKSTHSRPD